MQLFSPCGAGRTGSGEHQEKFQGTKVLYQFLPGCTKWEFMEIHILRRTDENMLIVPSHKGTTEHKQVTDSLENIGLPMRIHIFL